MTILKQIQNSEIIDSVYHKKYIFDNEILISLRPAVHYIFEAGLEIKKIIKSPFGD